MIQRHYLSAAWGDMPEEELQALVEDIKANGQREPIVLLDGQVLDGWHRYSACQRLGVECANTEFPADQDPVSWVISRNGHRRSLNASQKAMAVVECHRWAPPVRPNKGDGPSPFSTNAEMAREVGVSERTIKRAKKVAAKASPAVKEAVKAGTVNVEKAAAVVDLPKSQQAKALKQPKKADSERQQLADDAHGDTDPVQMLEEMQRENVALQSRCDALAADDSKAELDKYVRMYEHAQREQSAAMDRATKALEREKWLSRQLTRCGKAVGQDDPSKIAAAVEALARKAKA